MAAVWHCDNCGEPTLVNPPTEPIFEEKEIVEKVPTTVMKDGKKEVVWEEKKTVHKIPKVGKAKRQDPFTGEVEEIDVPEVRDLKPRAYLINLSVGQEIIQKDFCKKCLDEVLPEIQALWNKLESYKSKV